MFDESWRWKRILAWALLFLLVTPYLFYIVPEYLGMESYIVESGSMAPEMPKGSIVYESWSSPTALEEEDVIMFRPNTSEIDEDLVIHRIVEVREGNYTNYFRTKGDANDEPDPGWTPGYNVEGQRDFWIPYMGYVIMLTSSSPAIYLLVLVPAAIIMRSQLKNLFEALEERSEEQQNQGSESKSRVPADQDGEDENRQRIVFKDS